MFQTHPKRTSARSQNPGGDVSGSKPDQRAQIVLTAIINEHFLTGEPVSSKSLAGRFANAAGMSSATIRNVMGELEEMGLVEQPHTSAGRVPTDNGYRFYVDNLLGVLSISENDLGRIDDEFGIRPGESFETPDRLLERTSHLLSILSNNVGIVVSPSLANDRLQHIEFLSLSDSRVLVVLVSAPNIVHNKIIRTEVAFTREDLERTANYLNKEFAGKSLSEIRNAIIALMHQERALFDKLLQTAAILCTQSIEDDASRIGEVFVDGTSNILTMRDFADLERLRELLAAIGERSRLVQILNECIGQAPAVTGDVQVVIGSENRTPTLHACTLISAPYRIGDGSATGTLSVLGPTRMEYARMISIVSYVARSLEKIMSDERADE